MLELEEASLDPGYSPHSTTPSSSPLHQARISPGPRGPVYHPGPIRVGSEVADPLSGLISSCVTWQGPCHHKEGYTEGGGSRRAAGLWLHWGLLCTCGKQGLFIYSFPRTYFIFLLVERLLEPFLALSGWISRRRLVSLSIKSTNTDTNKKKRHS